MSSSYPDKVLEHVCSFIDSDVDKNVVSLVCKAWYEIERLCLRRVFIGNCYASIPSVLLQRFPDIRSLEIKGKPHCVDFNPIPHCWGGYIWLWIEAMATTYPWLEDLHLKGMGVTDDGLELIPKSFRNFKVLLVSSCEGFTTNGFATIVVNCRSHRWSVEGFSCYCSSSIITFIGRYGPNKNSGDFGDLENGKFEIGFDEAEEEDMEMDMLCDCVGRH